MSDKTLISWTDHTFNPWIGCTKVSAGCTHCYAERFSVRYKKVLWGPGSERHITKTTWGGPVKWNKRAEAEGRRHRVFCASLCDVFEDHPTANATRPRLWDLIRATPNLDWQLLTKRPERIAANLPADWGNGWQNVWLGTSIEDNRVVGRADHLRPIPAVVHFVSYEPALGPLDELDLRGIDWIIVGGESGSGYRPFDHQWARDLRKRCKKSGTAFFFKQSAAYRTELGIELDGAVVHGFPTPRQVEEAKTK